MPTSVFLTAINYYPNSADWFTQLRHLDLPIWLDSCYPKSTYGRFDILSAAPAVTLNTSGDTTIIQSGDTAEESKENPFSLLQTYLTNDQSHAEQVPFCGGAIGYFGY